jgi:hypothetical protein
MLRTQADTHQSRLDPDLDVLQSNKGKVEGLLHALKCITTAHIWGVGGGAPPLLCTLHSVPRMCVCCSICYWCVLSPYAMALHAAARLGLPARQTEKEDNDCLFLPPKTDPPTPHHTSGVDSHAIAQRQHTPPFPFCNHHQTHLKHVVDLPNVSSRDDNNRQVQRLGVDLEPVTTGAPTRPRGLAGRPTAASVAVPWAPTRPHPPRPTQGKARQVCEAHPTRPHPPPTQRKAGV